MLQRPHRQRLLLVVPLNILGHIMVVYHRLRRQECLTILYQQKERHELRVAQLIQAQGEGNVIKVLGDVYIREEYDVAIVLRQKVHCLHQERVNRVHTLWESGNRLPHEGEDNRCLLEPLRQEVGVRWVAEPRVSYQAVV